MYRKRSLESIFHFKQSQTQYYIENVFLWTGQKTQKMKFEKYTVLR